MMESMSMPGAPLAPKHLDDLALGIDVARFPMLETDDHFIAHARADFFVRLTDVDVVDDARIIGHDVEEILRMLERADDGVVRALQDANDATFRPGAAAFGASVLFIAGDPGHDAIAVHGGAGVLRGNEEVLLAGLILAGEEGETGLVNVQQAGDEVGFGGEDVAILADAGDLAGALQFAQRFVQVHPHAALAAEGFGELGLVERAVIRCGKDAQDLLGKRVVLGFHKEGLSTRKAGRANSAHSARDEYCGGSVSLKGTMTDAFWQFSETTIDFSEGALLMGVLNVTPDSFSDGGQFFDEEGAVAQGLRMIEEGARVIDIGGESTRPGAEAVPEAEELRRVLPVIRRLRAAHAEVLISIDTSKATVAREALAAGAGIINDITGGLGDPAMLPLAAESGAGLILMHMQGTPRTMQNDPQYAEVVTEVREFFRQQYEAALDCGIDSQAIAFDPGIGFGKTLQHNLELLRRLPELRVHDRPLVVGVSRKSFLGKVLDSPAMEDRLAPTVALSALLSERGADVLRVHDVKPNLAALKMARALRPAAV